MSKKNEKKTMEDYRKKQNRINTGAKVMAIILILSMLVFYVIAAGLEILS